MMFKMMVKIYKIFKNISVIRLHLLPGSGIMRKQKNILVNTNKVISCVVNDVEDV